VLGVTPTAAARTRSSTAATRSTRRCASPDRDNNKALHNTLTDNNKMSVATPCSVNCNDDSGASGVVLQGNQNELFYPQNVDDTRNDATGTQEFQVSAGGISLRCFIDQAPNTIARDCDHGRDLGRDAARRVDARRGCDCTASRGHHCPGTWSVRD
jgi:hypothetical protein